MQPHHPGSLRTRLISLGALCLFFVGLLVFFGATSSAQASSIITVTTTTDETNPADGTCSLREAITAIATGAAPGTAGECPAGSPGDSILVPSGTYTLSQGELVITTSLTISGSGQIDTIIDGNNQDRVIEIADPAAAVAVDGLTIGDGYTTSVPVVGGIVNSGTLTLTNSTLVSNTGDGVHSLGGLLVLNSVVSGNTGSGINNEAGVAVISGTTVSHNHAGGVYSSGPLNLTNSILISNTAGIGGGLYVYSGTQALVQDSTLAGNQSTMGAAIYNLGGLVLSNTNILSNTATDSGVIQNGWTGAPATMTVQNSTIASNSAKYAGSGIQNWRPSALTVTQTSFDDNLTTYAANGFGALVNEGSAWVSGTSFDHNQAETGAAIYNDVTLHVSDSTFSHNAATGSGGAMVSLNGTADINGTTFDGNSAGFEGGAVYGGALTLTNTSLVNNTAVQHGGAIASVTGDPVSAFGITVTNNTAQFGGGLFTLGTLQLSDSLVLSNSATEDGGGVYSFGNGISGHNPPPSVISQTQIVSNTANHGGGLFANYVLELTGSTLMSNTAALRGGGLYGNGKNLSVDNSTIALNRTAGNGGGIYVGNEYSNSLPALTLLNNVTLSGNVADQDNNGSGSGGGVFVEVTSTLRLSNTLLAGNQDLSGQAPDCAGTLTTGGHNLIQSTAGCTLSGTATGDLAGLSALLGPLQGNGGPTWTQALLPGSPAIDAGSPATPGSGGGACESTDQRGITRPQGLACDIGAYEAVGLSATATVQFATNAFAATQSAGTVPITATLSRAMAVTATVQYSTTDGTALAGIDYTAASGTLTFTPGVTQTTFSVPLLPAGAFEPDEIFSVALGAPANATLGAPVTATVTLLNDQPPPAIALSSSQYTVTESAGTAVITATLSAASGLTATVHYATSDGTALAGSDYTLVSGTLTFTPGLTQTAFAIPITPDPLHDADESLSVVLGAPVNATLGAPYTATVTILNDHSAPTVRFSSQAYTVTESTGPATITVTLSSASGLTATVNFATSNGTATAGSDYTPVSGTLTFAPGQVQHVFTVPITNNTRLEGPETVLLALSGPVEAALTSPSSATLNILDSTIEYRVYLPAVRRP